jgi:hypothetical protein
MLLFRSILAITIALLAAPVAIAVNYSDFRQFANVATTCEHQGKWREINWYTNIDQAKAAAQSQNKPILVFLVIGFHGEKNATDC